MSQTTTPSGTDVDPLAVLDIAMEYAIGADHETAEQEMAHLRRARTTVAALIARNAELEAERGKLRAANICYSGENANLLGRTGNAESRAAALAAENLALREALIDVRDNVRGDSPEMWHRVDAALALGEKRSDG